MKEIIIDGVAYTPKGEANAEKLDGMDYCIIRTYSAGVHTGYVESRVNREVVLRNSRRLWSWSGAKTLSELSRFGTEESSNCKFACEIDTIILTEAIEIIPCTEQGRVSIQGVPIWE